MKTSSIIFVIAALVILASCGETKKETTVAARNWQAATDWNFDLLAGHASLSENTTTKVWTITLTDVNPQMLAYTDRPDRLEQNTTVDYFISQWGQTFNDEKGVEISPNAALSGNTMTGAVVSPVGFVLTKPVYNAATKTLTYSATLVNPAIRPSATEIKEVNLAIDSTHWWNVVFTCGVGAAGAVAATAACVAEEVGTAGLATAACIAEIVADASEDVKCVCVVCQWKNYQTCIKDTCDL